VGSQATLIKAEMVVEVFSEKEVVRLIRVQAILQVCQAQGTAVVELVELILPQEELELMEQL
jgi:hypothetical protein